MNVFELFKESYGVGVVASKKQAKDPRYSHSLTKDVRPDTPKKNAKALMLASKNLNEAPEGQAVPDENLVNILKIIAGLESNGRNIKNQTGSGAHGIYQFMPETFELVKAGLDDSHPYKNASWDDFKENTDIQNSYASAGMMDNVRYLNNKKIPVNVETIYNAHHFGPFVASLMHKNPDRTLKDIYEQNKDIKGMPSWDKIKEQNPYLDDDSTGSTTVAYHKKRASNPAMQKFYDDVGVDVASVYDQDEISLPNEAPVVATTPAKEVNYDAFGNVIDEPDNTNQGPEEQGPLDKLSGWFKEKAKQLGDMFTEPDEDDLAARQDAINAELGGTDAAGETDAKDAEDEKASDVEKTSATDDAAVNRQNAINAELGGTDAVSAKTSLKDKETSTGGGYSQGQDMTYAEAGKEVLPSGVSWAQGNVSDAEEKLRVMQMNGTAQEVADAEKELADAQNTLQLQKDIAGGKGQVDMVLTKDQEEYMKAKEGALLSGKDDVTSIADDDLNRRRAEAVANQLEKDGQPEEAEKARAEAKRHEALRNEKLTKGITWGQGSLEQQEKQMKQWDKTESEGGDPAASWPGGVITDPAEKEKWQQTQTAADEKQKEEGNYTITKDVDDYQKEIDDDKDKNAIAQTKSNIEPEVQPEVSTTPSAPPATSYSSDVTSQGGPVKQGSGYSQGGVQTPEPKKEDPYPNPGYEGEELRIYNKLSDSQKAKVISDFEKSKKNAANARKNITPRSGPTSIPDPKPRSLLDIKHQQQLSGIEGGTQLVDPAKAKEVSKILGMSARTPEDKKKRDAALDAIRFKAPSMDELQKGMTPIVDKSINKDQPVKANVPAADTSDARSAIGKAVQSGTNLGKGNASQQAQDAQAKKAERDAKLAQQQAQQAQQKAEQEQKAAQQKAEAEAKAAQQKQEQEQKKAEAEAKRKEQEAARAKGVGTTSNMNTKTFSAKKTESVGESAIFKAISGK